jgi:hypothetical protein
MRYEYRYLTNPRQKGARKKPHGPEPEEHAG